MAALYLSPFQPQCFMWICSLTQQNQTPHAHGTFLTYIIMQNVYLDETFAKINNYVTAKQLWVQTEYHSGFSSGLPESYNPRQLVGALLSKHEWTSAL